MAKRIQSNVVEDCIRELLKADGFRLSAKRTRNGETGVDVLAEKLNDRIDIEVIGYKSTGSARSKDFFEVFFRAISRLKDGAKRCVIAMPSSAELGLPQRAKHYGAAWMRLGNAFPELEIWLVNLTEKRIKKLRWNNSLLD